MAREVVEVLTPFDANEAVQRMKIAPLVLLKGGAFDFRRFGDGGDATSAVLVNSLRIDFDRHPALHATLQKRARSAVVMLFLADLTQDLLPALQKLAPLVDLFLVPTPELKNMLAAFTDRRIEVLFDPIDFALEQSAPMMRREGVPKVVWFGYPVSYRLPLGTYLPALGALHRRGEIELHLVTKASSYGPAESVVIHEYVAENFLSLLESFDICLCCHTPFDFSAHNLLKSENKAVLAINRGLPVVASRTPAYERLLTACGLEEYLYSSTAELLSAIGRLARPEERERYLAKSQPHVLAHYSARKMADEWLGLYRAARARKNTPVSARLPAQGGAT